MLSVSAVLFLSVVSRDNRANAQIIPDRTLGTEQSQLLLDGTSIDGAVADLIRAGARRGANLFHSFEQFSIREGQRVYFDSPAGIERILSRVTGNTRSDIAGTLGSLGTADVFFINPNGIIFGPNARLHVGGSFFTSTADAIQFDDQGFFSARNPESPSALLTIDPSAFVFEQQLPRPIETRSVADGVGLQVPNGETLLLLGGDVVVRGRFDTERNIKGGVQALGGRIEIGSVVGPGSVALNRNNRFRFPDDLDRGNVSIETAIIDVASNNNGDIGVSAQTIQIAAGQLIAGIRDRQGAEGNQAGNIQLDATEHLQIEQESSVFNMVGTNAIGTGGDIKITTRVLNLQDRSQLNTNTLGDGDAGNILIEADARATFDESSVFNDVLLDAEGNGGDIIIMSQRLELLNGTELAASTEGFGSAGNILIEAGDRLLIAGTSANSGFASAIFTTVEETAVGNGGNIDITTQVLEVFDGAELNASTLGDGDAGTVVINARARVTIDASDVFNDVLPSAVGDGGSIVINTQILELLNGAELETSTNGIGQAGTIMLEAGDRILISGTSADGRVSSAAFTTVEEGAIGNGGNIEITTQVLEVLDGAELDSSTLGDGDAGNVLIHVTDRVTFDSSFVFSDVLPGADGKGGNIQITTPILNLQNGALLIASTEGTESAGDIVIESSDRIFLNNGSIQATSSSSGDGGNIIINTNVLTLDNQSRILTQTLSSDGGDVKLDLDNLLLLRDSSLISTEAGIAGVVGAGGDGGNVTINAQFIAALLDGNNDIVANAFDGTGGTVQIISDGLFGLEPRSALTLQSDITASSELGVDGRIEIQSPDVDPSQATVELPTAFVAPEVVRSCQATFAQSQSQFIISGRGGLPQNPADPLGAVALWQDILPIDNDDMSTRQSHTSRQAGGAVPETVRMSDPIVEVQGWIKQADGQVILVSETQQQSWVVHEELPICGPTNINLGQDAS